MNNKNLLNVGCGSKFNEKWENIDMVSQSRHVRSYNLIKGLPYADQRFQVVYHSQVLEHIPKENALAFISECYRVLQNDGFIRVVVPNLEGIILEYQNLLHKNIENPTDENKASYEWIMLELFDQTIRNRSGGKMKEFLSSPNLQNESYMKTRMGFVGRNIRKGDKENLNQKLKKIYKNIGFLGLFKIITIKAKQKILNSVIGEKYEIGSFRLGGEVHYWMYDRFSLPQLLKEAGFRNIKIQNPFSSDIPNWESHELDVKDGLPYDPTSLFVEAQK